MSENLIETFLWIKRLWFLWLPLISGYLFWETWLNRVRARFLKGINWVLLEMMVPRDIAKSPKAMETVLTSLHSVYAGNWLQRVKNGFLPWWYSLEIVSINGSVHFYIYAQAPYKNLVQSQIYAQYPDVEINEAEDYTGVADFGNLNDWNVWGTELGFTKPDPYPIRTYVDFGLAETMTKEEQKVNPLVSFLEFLGSLKEGEQIWFQIMIRGAGKKWMEEGKALISELMGRNRKVKEGESKAFVLSKTEQEITSAIGRSIAKLGFESGVRMLYIARKDIFNNVNKAALSGVINQYNAPDLNGFKSARTTSPSPLGFILKARREAARKKVFVDAYRKRSYFYIPYRRKPVILNVEELATIYHFPGRVAETPTFGRVDAKKGEPPPTLPI